jgi:hypothetical protein
MQGFMPAGFTPQLVLTHTARATNAQTEDYKGNAAELRFTREF